MSLNLKQCHVYTVLAQLYVEPSNDFNLLFASTLSLEFKTGAVLAGKISGGHGPEDKGE